MLRRCKWLGMAAVVAAVSFAQPGSSGVVEAGAGPRPSVVAACKDAGAKLAAAQVQIEQLQRDNRELRRELTALRDAERARAKRLADQLGGSVIEQLH